MAGKRSLTLLFALLTALLLTACGSSPAEEPAGSAEPDTAQVRTPADTAEPAEPEVPVQPEESEEPPAPVPIYASQIADGAHEIEVDSSSSMFRVVECVLTVEGDAMTAAMTMSGQGYGMVYMGTGEEALADTEDAYIPFVQDETEARTFTVPVEALNVELDCAAWSIRKEKWYDRVLVFKSDLLPEEAIIEE